MRVRCSAEEVTGSFEHRSLLMCPEVQNLNDHETLDMAQGNRKDKDKDKGRDMTQAVNKDFVRGLFQSLGPSFQMQKHDKEIA